MADNSQSLAEVMVSFWLSGLTVWLCLFCVWIEQATKQCVISMVARLSLALCLWPSLID